MSGRIQVGAYKCTSGKERESVKFIVVFKCMHLFPTCQWIWLHVSWCRWTANRAASCVVGMSLHVSLHSIHSMAAGGIWSHVFCVLFSVSKTLLNYAVALLILWGNRALQIALIFQRVATQVKVSAAYFVNCSYITLIGMHELHGPQNATQLGSCNYFVGCCKSTHPSHPMISPPTSALRYGP